MRPECLSMWAWHWNGSSLALWPARLTIQLKLSVVNGPPRSDVNTTSTYITVLKRKKVEGPITQSRPQPERRPMSITELRATIHWEIMAHLQYFAHNSFD